MSASRTTVAMALRDSQLRFSPLLAETLIVSERRAAAHPQRAGQASPGNVFNAPTHLQPGFPRDLSESRVMVGKAALRPRDHDFRVSNDVELLRERGRTQEKSDNRDESHHFGGVKSAASRRR